MLRIARSKHGALYRQCLARGWEREDLDQELVLGVLLKQGEGSTYEPTRAGLGKYLVVATGGILRHLLERASTLKATMVSSGVTVTRDGERVTVDAAEVAIADWVEPCATAPQDAAGEGGKVRPGRRARRPRRGRKGGRV